MSAEERAGAPPTGLYIGIGATTLMLGLLGGTLITGWIGGSETVEAPELGASDVDRRVNRLAPAENDPTTPEPVPDPAPLAAPAPSAPPEATEATTPIWDTGGDARAAERRILAVDSPLTPPARDFAALIERGGSTQEETEAPAQKPVGPEIVTPLPGEPGNSSTTRDHVLARGSVIPAVLESPIDSALPGLVRARVTEDVRDTATGHHVLIPRGAWLIGTYGSDAGSGQERLFVTWTDLRMPGAEQALTLREFSALGPDGVSGVKGRRTTGFLTALGGAILLDLAGNATSILTGRDTTGGDGDLSSLLAAATGRSTGSVANRWLEERLSRAPRFRVAPGTFLNVLVEADMRLPAWSNGR